MKVVACTIGALAPTTALPQASRWLRNPPPGTDAWFEPSAQELNFHQALAELGFKCHANMARVHRNRPEPGGRTHQLEKETVTDFVNYLGNLEEHLGVQLNEAEKALLKLRFATLKPPET